MVHIVSFIVKSEAPPGFSASFRKNVFDCFEGSIFDWLHHFKRYLWYYLGRRAVPIPPLLPLKKYAICFFCLFLLSHGTENGESMFFTLFFVITKFKYVFCCWGQTGRTSVGLHSFLLSSFLCYVLLIVIQLLSCVGSVGFSRSGLSLICRK